MLSKKQQAYREYLNSKEWAQTRCDLLTLRGAFCEVCGSAKMIQVHHLTYSNIRAEEPEDLIILCGKCHMAEHNIKRKKHRKQKMPSLKQPDFNSVEELFKRKLLIRDGQSWRCLAKTLSGLLGRERDFKSKNKAKKFIQKYFAKNNKELNLI